MSGPPSSSDNYATTPGNMKKWDAVDLFCPHPLLKEGSRSKATTATSRDDSDLPRGLLSTTAFRSETQIHQPPQQFRSVVKALLQLCQQVRPQDIHRHATALCPIVSEIFRMYLRNELVLTMDELAQVRELGRTVVEHCREHEYARAAAGRSETGMSDWIPGRNIGTGSRAATGGANPQEHLARTTAVYTTERNGYASREIIHT
ncbi:hypothetical protein FRC11_002891 [Ceratobasidium sp. 423]|nr:hypothetical protein FRC11_002891 [Ceratobasidium sp. 423]